MQSWITYTEQETDEETPVDFPVKSFQPIRLFYAVQTVDELPIRKTQAPSLGFLCTDVPSGLLNDLPSYRMKKDAGPYTVLVECFACNFDLIVDFNDSGDFTIQNTAATCCFTITGTLPFYPESVTVHSVKLHRFSPYLVPETPLSF